MLSPSVHTTKINRYAIIILKYAFTLGSINARPLNTPINALDSITNGLKGPLGAIKQPIKSPSKPTIPPEIGPKKTPAREHIT